MSDNLEGTLGAALAECGVELNEDELKRVVKSLRSSWGKRAKAKAAAKGDE